jgi:hypothetical protein
VKFQQAFMRLLRRYLQEGSDGGVKDLRKTLAGPVILERPMDTETEALTVRVKHTDSEGNPETRVYRLLLQVWNGEYQEWQNI